MSKAKPDTSLLANADCGQLCVALICKDIYTVNRPGRSICSRILTTIGGLVSATLERSS